MEENLPINSIISINKFNERLNSVNIDIEIFANAIRHTFGRSLVNYSDIIAYMRRVGMIFKYCDIEYVPITPPIAENEGGLNYIPDEYYDHNSELRKRLGIKYKTLISEYYKGMMHTYYIVDPAEISNLDFNGSGQMKSKYYYSSKDSKSITGKLVLENGAFVGVCSYDLDSCNAELINCVATSKLSFKSSSSKIHITKSSIGDFDFGFDRDYGEIEFSSRRSSFRNVDIYGAYDQDVNLSEVKCSRFSAGSRCKRLSFFMERSIIRKQTLSSTDSLKYKILRSLVSAFDINSQEKTLIIEGSVISSIHESRVSGRGKEINNTSITIINSKIFSSIDFGSTNFIKFEMRNTRMTRFIQVGMANFSSRPLVERVGHSKKYFGATDDNLQLLESFLDIIYDQQKKFNSHSGEIAILSLKFDLIRGYSSEHYGFLEKILNYLYYITSGYGRSITKPIIFLLVVFFLQFSTDIIVLTFLGSYRLDFSVHGVWETLKVAAYSLQDTPFTILTNYERVEVNFPTLYLIIRIPLQVILSISYFCLVFLSLLAVRRRYQIH